jgi:glycosyltransferase involved in cell wall biosynthesis
MYPRKNLQVLVTAAALLHARLPDMRVRLIGDGPERGRLERQVRRLKLTDSVEFAGQVTYGALVEAYASCDVFCLPSLQEGFGIVFLEAMIAGKPVVACRGTAAEELVDTDLGILVPTDDAGALADALHRLLTDPIERARLGSRGPARAEAFAPLPTARRFMEAVTSVSTSAPRAQ